MGITKYGSGDDGRVLKDDKKQAQQEWTEQDSKELVEEQADVLVLDADED